jgi:hypothetical protein
VDSVAVVEVPARVLWTMEPVVSVGEGEMVLAVVAARGVVSMVSILAFYSSRPLSVVAS